MQALQVCAPSAGVYRARGWLLGGEGERVVFFWEIRIPSSPPSSPSITQEMGGGGLVTLFLHAKCKSVQRVKHHLYV